MSTTISAHYRYRSLSQPLYSVYFLHIIGIGIGLGLGLGQCEQAVTSKRTFVGRTRPVVPTPACCLIRIGGRAVDIQLQCFLVVNGHSCFDSGSVIKVDVTNANIKDGEKMSRDSAFQLDIHRKQSGGYTQIKPLCTGRSDKTFNSISLIEVSWIFYQNLA